MLRACCVQHPNISGPPPCSPWHNTQAAHVATMLRTCCMQHTTSGALLPLLDTKPNTTCLQHQNSTSATLQFNVYNIQHQVSSLPLDTTPNITCLQHRNSTFATSKINVCNIKIHFRTKHLQHVFEMFATSQHLDLLL
jgi:hypothetical protein